MRKEILDKYEKEAKDAEKDSDAWYAIGCILTAIVLTVIASGLGLLVAITVKALKWAFS